MDIADYGCDSWYIVFAHQEKSMDASHWTASFCRANQSARIYPSGFGLNADAAFLACNLCSRIFAPTLSRSRMALRFHLFMARLRTVNSLLVEVYVKVHVFVHVQQVTGLGLYVGNMLR
jgi:hypothetical protein